MTGSTVDPLTAILATNHIACMTMLNNTENSYSPGKKIKKKNILRKYLIKF